MPETGGNRVKMGVLGCGRMASAVVEGIYSSGTGDEWDFVTYTPGHTRAAELAAKVKGRAITTLGELGHTDILLIGCKPHQFSSLAHELRGEKIPLGELVSIMAAVSVKDIRVALKVNKVVRLMPSMPMRQGEGISLLYSDTPLGEPHRQSLVKALGACSQVVELKSEELLDRLTVVTASGPAYIYYFARLFEDILNEWQDDRTLSRHLAVRLFKGASVAMEGAESDSLEELIAGVTSEKGVTAEALASFQRDDLKGLLCKGVEKAWDRLVEIKTGEWSR